MLRLIALVISIGLADSVNPSTIAPGLFLASGPGARKRVTQFTAGVFAVYFVGGAAMALGPGQILLALVPRPGPTVRYVLETIAGVVMLIAAALLWRKRRRLGSHELPQPQAEGRSSALLGVTITLVELPTAFPYFAAIAAIVGSGFDPARQVLLLALYNACFVLPLILIIVTLATAGDRAERILTATREWLQERWPVLLAGAALLAGLFVAALGATGLAGSGHGAIARFSRKLRHLISH